MTSCIAKTRTNHAAGHGSYVRMPCPARMRLNLLTFRLIERFCRVNGIGVRVGSAKAELLLRSRWDAGKNNMWEGSESGCGTQRTGQYDRPLFSRQTKAKSKTSPCGQRTAYPSSGRIPRLHTTREVPTARLIDWPTSQIARGVSCSSSHRFLQSLRFKIMDERLVPTFL